jgi:hypothetical protein
MTSSAMNEFREPPTEKDQRLSAITPLPPPPSPPSSQSRPAQSLPKVQSTKSLDNSGSSVADIGSASLASDMDEEDDQRAKLQLIEEIADSLQGDFASARQVSKIFSPSLSFWVYFTKLSHFLSSPHSEILQTMKSLEEAMGSAEALRTDSVSRR